MSGNVIAANWCRPIYRCRAFWLDERGVLVDRGSYELVSRTTEDDPSDFMWLQRQIDFEAIPLDRMCATDLRCEYLQGGVIIGRDPTLGIIRLLITPSV